MTSKPVCTTPQQPMPSQPSDKLAHYIPYKHRPHTQIAGESPHTVHSHHNKYKKNTRKTKTMHTIFIYD